MVTLFFMKGFAERGFKGLAVLTQKKPAEFMRAGVRKGNGFRSNS